MLEFEVQLVGIGNGVTRRRYRQLHGGSVDGFACRQRVRRDHYGLQVAVLGFRDRLYGKRRRANRQRDLIDVLRRRKAWNGVAVHLDIYERVIRQGAYAERQGVVLGIRTVSRRHADRSGAAGRGRLRISDILGFLLFVGNDLRNRGGTERQGDIIRILGRTESRHGDCVGA